MGGVSRGLSVPARPISPHPCNNAGVTLAIKRNKVQEDRKLNGRIEARQGRTIPSRNRGVRSRSRLTEGLLGASLSLEVCGEPPGRSPKGALSLKSCVIGWSVGRPLPLWGSPETPGSGPFAFPELERKL